jgi:3-hydroxybutyryl-CoA dehydrogenase
VSSPVTLVESAAARTYKQAMAINHILVVGAGQMGAGIAQVSAVAGFTVTLSDVSAQMLEKGLASIDKSLGKLVEKGKLEAAAKAAALARISMVGSILEAKDVDAGIEAVSENEELKKKIFRELDQVVRPGGLLASNTSSIPITRIGAVTRRPDAVIGMHFMNPVPLMQLVELIRGAATSDETYAQTRAMAEKMGKITVVSKDFPGFIVNRILIPMLNEACFALAEGIATAEDIDTAMKLGTNVPMGPLTLADFIGLDTVLSIAEVLHKGLGESKYRPSPLLRQYVEAGWLGKKTGRGFYKYS